MNVRRRILAVAALAVLVNFGFPPWLAEFDAAEGGWLRFEQRPAGRHFILAPPADAGTHVGIDTTLLAASTGVILIVAAVLLIVTSAPRTLEDPNAWPRPY